MANRSSFLLGSGATLLGGAAVGIGSKVASAAVAAPNIIIPGRGGTAYFANIPRWTPREALHPATRELNRFPRFNDLARRSIPNIDRAMSATRLIRTPSPQNLCQSNCGGGGSGIKPNITTSARTSSSAAYYAGLRYGTVSKSLPAIDAAGANFNSYMPNASTLQMNGVGVNPVNIASSNVHNYASGTYQYGTTTITVHPTLPQVRWTDPVMGSGVIYYDQPQSKIVIGNTSAQVLAANNALMVADFFENRRKQKEPRKRSNAIRQRRRICKSERGGNG